MKILTKIQAESGGAAAIAAFHPRFNVQKMPNRTIQIARQIPKKIAKNVVDQTRLGFALVVLTRGVPARKSRTVPMNPLCAQIPSVAAM
jgi:hypothetical protein